MAAASLKTEMTPSSHVFPHRDWGRGKAALGFGPDLIRILVPMATDSSHKVIMGGNVVAALAALSFIGSSSFLQVRRTTIKS